MTMCHLIVDPERKSEDVMDVYTHIHTHAAWLATSRTHANRRVFVGKSLAPDARNQWSWPGQFKR